MTGYLPPYKFPDPRNAPGDRPIAAGGDLNEPTLLHAYSRGIFPWYDENTPILWWSPDPRVVLYPGYLRVTRSLSRVIRSGRFGIRFDGNFESVIRYCAEVPRKAQSGTWITGEMIEAYIRLHQSGYAHSVETYMDGELCGGLYGVSLGGIFFGESMFHLVRDASKVALYCLVQRLLEWNFDLIDVQQSTGHMRRMGAVEIPRDEFLDILEKSMERKTVKGPWNS